MQIGLPREIKVHEHRVGLTPDGVRELTQAGHGVVVQTEAGAGAGFEDRAYAEAGAAIVADAAEVFAGAELIVKVKEPQLAECARLSPGQILFTYLHLAADPAQARALIESGATAIAYETVTGPAGSLPLLKPMSSIAGRMATQVGAHYLEKPAGGAGILLGGVPGVRPARVVVLGAGVAGTHALEMAVGMQAEVVVIDKRIDRLDALAERFASRIRALYATGADLPGAAAPKLLTRGMLRDMRPGAVVVDIAIDQGGCFETSRATHHAEPVYVESGVVHYCVTNMPGAVPRTATLALSNATLPHIRALADLGWREAMQRDPGLRNGLNVHAGQLRHPAVIEALGPAPASSRAA